MTQITVQIHTAQFLGFLAFVESLAFLLQLLLQSKCNGF